MTASPSSAGRPRSTPKPALDGIYVIRTPVSSGQRDPAGRPYHSFRGLLEHLATLPRNQVQFAGTLVTVPMLTEPTGTQRVGLSPHRRRHPPHLDVVRTPPGQTKKTQVKLQITHRTGGTFGLGGPAGEGWVQAPASGSGCSGREGGSAAGAFPSLPALASRVPCAHVTGAVRRAGGWAVLLALGLHSVGELYGSETAGPAAGPHRGRLRA
jgi:hypothetical protein